MDESWSWLAKLKHKKQKKKIQESISIKGTAPAKRDFILNNVFGVAKPGEILAVMGSR